MRDPRGFTLLELAFVLAIIAILAASVVPGSRAFIGRNRALEARTALEAIVHAEHAYRRDHGRYIACPPSLAEPPRGIAGTFDANAPGWKELGIELEGEIRYRYEVQVEGDRVIAIATGDLDGDGNVSRFTLDGSTLAFDVRDELE